MRLSIVCLSLVLAGCAAAADNCMVTLTARSPKATCAVPREWASQQPKLVEVPVTNIDNPTGQSFSIYLHGLNTKGEEEVFGNVTVYPANQTGVFTMRLPASKTPARLSLEIRRINQAQPWKPITVSIGPLRWLR